MALKLIILNVEKWWLKEMNEHLKVALFYFSRQGLTLGQIIDSCTQYWHEGGKWTEEFLGLSWYPSELHPISFGEGKVMPGKLLLRLLVPKGNSTKNERKKQNVWLLSLPYINQHCKAAPSLKHRSFLSSSQHKCTLLGFA